MSAILKNKLKLPKDSMRMLESLPAKPVLLSILSQSKVMNAILMLSAPLPNLQAVLLSVSTQPPLRKILPQCFQSPLLPQTLRLRSSCTRVFSSEMSLMLTFQLTSHFSHADLVTQLLKLSLLSSMEWSHSPSCFKWWILTCPQSRISPSRLRLNTRLWMVQSASE